jgi:hypothetical protein
VQCRSHDDARCPCDRSPHAAECHLDTRRARTLSPARRAVRNRSSGPTRSRRASRVTGALLRQSVARIEERNRHSRTSISSSVSIRSKRSVFSIVLAPTESVAAGAARTADSRARQHATEFAERRQRQPPPRRWLTAPCHCVAISSRTLLIVIIFVDINTFVAAVFLLVLSTDR